ncbi:Uncharacterised protein [Mycobacterium tuberculosis]|uniref:Uncharacterized protein n=1 Tax=Mycobacterium tuberculosis TaxID=1773 RepID=A0A654TM67_MYCTX|nr:Uncharacterised protein [Mycobacterium tuberculosis]
MALATSPRSSSARTSISGSSTDSEKSTPSASSAPWRAARSESRVCTGWESTVACRTEAATSVGSTSGTDSAVTISLAVSFSACTCPSRYTSVCATSRSTPNVDRLGLKIVDSPGRGTPVSWATTSRNTPVNCADISSAVVNRCRGSGSMALRSNRP